MAEFVALKPVNFDNKFSDISIINDGGTAYSNTTSGGFTATNGNVQVDIIGTAFGYNSGVPDDNLGTVSAITTRTDGSVAYSFTGLNLNYFDFQDSIGSGPPENVLGLDGPDSFTGSPFADILYSYHGNDVVRGGGGGDVLDGGADDDRLFGDAGADWLRGSFGKDTLIGGAGRDLLEGDQDHDIFKFNAASDSRVGAKHDVILDFARGDDRIDLRTIDANRLAAGNQAFHFIGAQSFQAFAAAHPAAHGLLRYANGIVSGDVNGDLHADFAIGIDGGIPTLAASDFML